MNVLKAVLLSAALSIGSLGVTGAKAANIVDTAAAVGTFNTLIAAATAAGVADALATTENLTVFAPTDEAFAALPAGTVEDLLKPENKDKLAAILTLHVLPRVLKAYQMLDSISREDTERDRMTNNLGICKRCDGLSYQQRQCCAGGRTSG